MQNIFETIQNNWLAVIVIVIAFIFYLFGNRLRGYLGELKASNVLNKLPKRDYIILNDLMLFSDSKTHQIDHVVISRFGIFVIEMKNYQGKVVGSEFKDNWTQYIGSKTNTFYNPVKQNYGHLRCLSDVLDLDMDKFIPIVVFSNETDIKTEVDYVINLNDTVRYIKSFKKDKDIDVDKVKEKLLSLNITDRKERMSHVSKLKKNVKKDSSKALSGVCPKCNSKMIVKKNYMACTNCKYTKDL